MQRIINLIFSFFRTKDILFVGATDILKPPLTKEEEERLVDEKDKGSMEAKNMLIEHNLRLVVFLAKKYENTSVDLEDLVSIGSIGLIKGVNTFSKGKNIKLATYASRCIDNEILMYLRKIKKTKADISIDASLSYDIDGNELRLEDVLGTEIDTVTKPLEDKYNKRILLKELSELNKRDKEIMVLRYGLNGYDEMTQKEVAKYLKISQSYISRIEKKVIKRLKNIIKV